MRLNGQWSTDDVDVSLSDRTVVVRVKLDGGGGDPLEAVLPLVADQAEQVERLDTGSAWGHMVAAVTCPSGPTAYFASRLLAHWFCKKAVQCSLFDCMG